MSSGHYCVIRDLGLVKGGKGLRHHEVVLDVSWRGLIQFAKSMLRRETNWVEPPETVRGLAGQESPNAKARPQTSAR